MVTDHDVYNATIDVRSGSDRVATLTLSLETSAAILSEAWDKFHNARKRLNDLAEKDGEASPEYAHNLAKRLLWEVSDMKQAIEAIYALTPLPESDFED